MKTIFKVIMCFSFLVSTFNLKAQEDKISGIYIDGVKVTEIDCYSFWEMEVIFPIDKLKTFDQISIDLHLFKDQSKYSTLSVSKGSNYASLFLKSFTANGLIYARAKIFEKDKFYSNLDGVFKFVHRNDFYVKANANMNNYLKLYITPQMISSYEEKYDESCSCIKKNPIYQGETANEFRLELKPNTNNNSEPKDPKTLKERLKGPESLKIDLTLPCPVKGQKLEDLLKSETKANPSKTDNATSGTLTPVTEKHKNGKVKVQGQNNKEGNHEGTWKYFNEAGKLDKVENYKNGISHGEGKYYDVKTGKVTKTEKYNEGELVQ